MVRILIFRFGDSSGFFGQGFSPGVFRPGYTRPGTADVAKITLPLCAGSPTRPAAIGMLCSWRATVATRRPAGRAAQALGEASHPAGNRFPLPGAAPWRRNGHGHYRRQAVRSDRQGRTCGFQAVPLHGAGAVFLAIRSLFHRDRPGGSPAVLRRSGIDTLRERAPV